MAKQKFKTEVSQLLQLIIHSLYSNKEIFLRELISNSSDALDKLRYLSLTDKKYKGISVNPKISISFLSTDKKKTITISDNGIGMDKDDLVSSLGTIARSGTKKFIETLSGDSKKDSNLIGQFGVGFYSCFMVADKVEVLTKKALDKTAYLWKSDGQTGFTITESEKEESGTQIILYLNENGAEYATKWSIDSIIKKYSDHIAFPIELHYTEEKDKKVENKVEQVNSASAFWKKSKSSLKDKDYNEFYKTLSGDNDDPLMHIHTQAEGNLVYSTLFYIPKKAPFDMFRADYKSGIKLYINRVFITDDDKELMPTYLRFARGVIDSEDLPLNVSREILQKNQILEKIKKNSTKKLLTELQTLLDSDKKKYIEFFEQYGIPLKEGLYQDFENKESLLDLMCFKTNKSDDYITLKEYVDKMKKDQKSIFFLTGAKLSELKNSPLLEVCNKKDIQVLLMDHEIDEMVFGAMQKYKDHDFKSINHANALEEIKDEKSKDDKKKKTDVDPLIKKVKKVLGDKVKDVVSSQRLSDSPACVVADSNDPTAQMQDLMRQMGQAGLPDSKPIFEINPDHKIIKKLSKMSKNKLFDDSVMLLFDQALLVSNIKIENPGDFISRINKVLEKSL
ncbi:molecular chaperone HtpG [Candidatus Marinimicrobia bacterium]|nr:molecular chaperone HtpG [Candidatus Neomarinimicrobiota bacterium]